MKEIKLGIFNNFETGPDGYDLYVTSCEDLNVDYEVIDIISSNWIDNVRNSDCDAFLVRPSPRYSVWKRMYDERLYFIVNKLNKLIYPSYHELYMYENKRNMAYFLQINGIPMPKTNIFYDKDEALEFAEEAEFPLVFKTHIGAAASGVKVIKSKRQGRKFIKAVFRRGYTRKRRITLRGMLPHGISVPYYIFDKEYKVAMFQEFLSDVAEWRIIRIGDSYFGHQKLKRGKFHSGSGRVGWVDPPEDLLRFAKSVCDTGGFWSMCLDIFEDQDGKYYVNELQSVFGSYDNSQMYIDGIPGRYMYNEEKDRWDFEEGYFNQNGSCDLRVKHLIKILKDRELNVGKFEKEEESHDNRYA